MATLLKGAPVTAALNEKLAAKTAALAQKGITPTLAIVRVGQKPDDIAYERSATKRCAQVGVAVRPVLLPESVAQADLMAALEGLNQDAAVHGVLLFRPLPKHLDDAAVRNTLAPEKDVDGITDLSLAGVFTGGGRGYPPCTAAACMEILAHYGIDPAGLETVVVGRSLTVGKPAAMMLLAKNATVTVCHTRTANMAAVCKRARLLIVSAGRPGVIGAGHLAPGQTVIDVGINVDEAGQLCGDVDFAAAEPIVEAITPVPGGVGGVTSSLLAAHVVEAAEKAAQH